MVDGVCTHSPIYHYYYYYDRYSNKLDLNHSVNQVSKVFASPANAKSPVQYSWMDWSNLSKDPYLRKQQQHLLSRLLN